MVEGILELASGGKFKSTDGHPGAARWLALSAGICLLLVLEWPSNSVWALGTLFVITLLSSALKVLQELSGETFESNFSTSQR